jgi:hypothetical protein
MRQEFKKSVQVTIIKRSMINGIPTCEEIEDGARCGCTRGLEVHHEGMDAMKVDKSRPLTADDGRNLCKPHHAIITARQMGVLSIAIRQEAAHLGADKPNKAEIMGRPKANKSSPKLDGIRELGGSEMVRRYAPAPTIEDDGE